jgi:hypothetical protein
MAFGIVPAREWQLKPAVGGSRRKCLLETPFDSIVQQITSEALLSECKWKKIRKIHDARRIFIKLTLAPQTVDLFHNGASGYRAQFYFGIQQGEAANRRLIDSWLDKIKGVGDIQDKLGCPWEFIEASLRHHDVKVWIHEGGWLSDNKPMNQNLTVDRWERNAHKITLAHRFEPSWARLTPDSEAHLELKGGCLDQAFHPIDVLLKPTRSSELHEHGYT